MASPRRFLNRIIIFISEKERSTEAVPTGIAKHTFVILKFGHIVSGHLTVPLCHPSVELL